MLSAVLAQGHGVQGHSVAHPIEGPRVGETEVLFPTCLSSHDPRQQIGTGESYEH